MAGLSVGRLEEAGDLRVAVCSARRGRHDGRQYDVAPDGRFLINTVLDSAPAPITLLQNWQPEGKK
jgi:hypothetical protein